MLGVDWAYLCAHEGRYGDRSYDVVALWVAEAEVDPRLLLLCQNNYDLSTT